METQTENTLEKVDLSPPEVPGTKAGPEPDIISQFDEILGKNLDRLLGVRQGIEALPINIFTVSCLILLATRETEIQGFPYLPPERYTHESLLHDMSDMNIEHGGDLETYINSMLDKRYIKVEIDGRLFPGPPIMKMAVLFDRIFPKMPGLNLVAYLGQMIDEVLSNRKLLNTALNQFDQMLSMQGVSLKTDCDSTHQEATKAFPHLKVSETPKPVKKKIIITDIKPSDIYSKLQAKAWTGPQNKAEIPIPSFDLESEEMNREASGDLLIRDDDSPVSGADFETDIKEQIQETKSDATYEEAGEGIDPEHGRDLSGDDTHALTINKSISTRGYDQDFDTEPEDDDIEKKIAAFEEQLSMACPLCRTSGLVPRTTARGKSYYKCSNEDCNFISWGKPYYLACPRCENPFLIETPNSQGNMVLKCPRTTCPHWQKFPWDEDDEQDIKSLAQKTSAGTVKKPRRVVRRRKRVVVRRKS
jgi:hypothetical protein